MFDARIFIPNLDKAREVLKQNNATEKGYYEIHDAIYAAKDPETGELQDLGSVFMRLRSVPVNIWDEPAYIVAIKNTELKEVGKKSIIPLKKGFDTEADAKAFIAQNYADAFEFAYEFDRVGWQYFIGKDGVDLEDVEGHCTIEFKSETEEGLRALLNLFGVTDDQVIKGPSVVEIRKILGR